MLSAKFLVRLSFLAVVPALLAGDIEGTIVVKRKLTKARVTAAPTAYQRGAAVELNANAAENPLAFERSHVVIYLEGPGLDAAKPDGVKASIEQKSRSFEPDLVVIPAGASVAFPNLDPIFHNVFSLSKTKAFDLGNYSKGQSRVVPFPKPGIVLVGCHLHSNMSAVIVVSPNQWSTIADGEGKFSFTGVPDGRYTAVAWHKSAGFFRQQVTVAKGRPAAAQFLIPLEALPTGSVANR